MEHLAIILSTTYPRILLSCEDNSILLLLNEEHETFSLSKIIDAFSNKENHLIKINNSLTLETWTFDISIISNALSLLMSIGRDDPEIDE